MTGDHAPEPRLGGLDPVQLTGLGDMEPAAFRVAAHRVVDLMAVYLLQAPVYIALEPLALRAGAPGLHGRWFWIYLIALLASSALVYQFFERPMRNWLRPKSTIKTT